MAGQPCTCAGVRLQIEKIGLDNMVTSTTLEINKSLFSMEGI
jgi:hypothetical protein